MKRLLEIVESITSWNISGKEITENETEGGR